MIDDALEASLAMHDELVTRRGVEVWIGAEPTFTRADSLDPAWIALGAANIYLAVSSEEGLSTVRRRARRRALSTPRR